MRTLTAILAAALMVFGADASAKPRKHRPKSYRTPYSARRYYTDVDGDVVSGPVRADRAPSGATARCRDGTYSFAHHHRGACSRHGGVAKWL